MTSARGTTFAMRFAGRAHHPCRAGSSETLAYLPNDPELFGLGRARITEVGPMPAGRRDREGSPMAVHRDQEGSPTGNSPFFIVARGPVPRDLHWPVMFLGPTD